MAAPQVKFTQVIWFLLGLFGWSLVYGGVFGLFGLVFCEVCLFLVELSCWFLWQLFINGEFVPSVSGKTFAAVNPATGEEICRVAEAEKVWWLRLLLGFWLRLFSSLAG